MRDPPLARPTPSPSPTGWPSTSAPPPATTPTPSPTPEPIDQGGRRGRTPCPSGTAALVSGACGRARGRAHEPRRGLRRLRGPTGARPVLGGVVPPEPTVAHPGAISTIPLRVLNPGTEPVTSPSPDVACTSGTTVGCVWVPARTRCGGAAFQAASDRVALVWVVRGEETRCAYKPEAARVHRL